MDLNGKTKLEWGKITQMFIRLAVVLFILFVLSLGLFVFGRWYEAPSQEEQEQHLCELFLRIDLYHSIYAYNSNNHQTPAKISDLYPKYIGTEFERKRLACPSTKDTPGKMKNVDNWSSYIVFFHLGKDLNPNSILACDKPGNHKEGVNVLFGDGRVEFVTYKELAQILLQQYGNLENQVLDFKREFDP